MQTRSFKCQKHEVTFELDYHKASYKELTNDFDEINKMIEQGYNVIKIGGGTACCYVDLIKEII